MRRFVWYENGNFESLLNEDSNYLYFESGEKVNKNLIGVTIEEVEIEEDNSNNDFYLNEEQKNSGLVNGLPVNSNAKDVKQPVTRTDNVKNPYSDELNNNSNNNNSNNNDILFEHEQNNNLNEQPKNEVAFYSKKEEYDPIIQLIEKSKKSNKNLQLDVKLEVPNADIIKIIKENFNEDVFYKIAEYNLQNLPSDEIIEWFKQIIAKSLQSSLRKNSKNNNNNKKKVNNK